MMKPGPAWPCVSQLISLVVRAAGLCINNIKNIYVLNIVILYTLDSVLILKCS